MFKVVDLEGALKLVRSDDFCIGWVTIQHFPPNVLDDFDVGLAVAENNPLEISYLSERLRDDAKIIRTAVNRNGVALQFASTRLRDDYDLVMAALRNRGEALRFVGDSLRTNLGLIATALHNCGEALKFIPSNFIDVGMVALAAGSWDGAEQYAKSVGFSVN